ncbi:transglutaminase-like domain-containing protein [Psychroserpens ponticola]|uniref:Transglutaminase-like domain-containing protein n=1 Tax=Psychroserpens ponticola TaxID=2932268 RepID=A0ABY7S314_9FLAO|nr:transglutaminase-like domain-containing protein [Psychroserpens ponticola]WCO03362.1 transglutaminase-like domain-containing protein [Psychroserpens ponticola]
MIKYTLSVIICLTLTCSAFSQKRIEPATQDITLATSLKEQYPDDNVALVSSKDQVTFGLNKRDGKVTVMHHVSENMINIDSRADIQVYNFYDGESTIEEFQIRYKNKKEANFFVKDEAYTSDDLFHNDSRVQYANIDFPLKGYRYLTSIKKEYKDIKYFTKLYFNGEYPTVKKTIRIEIPNWLDIELRELNFDGYAIEKSVHPNQKGNGKIHTYTLKDTPGMYKDNSAPGPTYIYPHVLVLPKSYTLNGKTVNIFKETQDLYNWYKSLVNSLENDNAPITDKVIELTANATSDEEKIKNIYYWVQDNIRYIAFEDGIAGFKPDEAANVFTKRYGDCKGMANLTKQMLIEAGFDARLTWIGTKRIAYDYSTPNLSVDNHMICTLFKDGKTIFLDGTEKFNAYGEYADRIQGKQVLIENGDEFILEYVPTSEAEFNKEQFAYSLKLSEDNMIGKVDKTYNGESRSGLLYYFNSLKNDKKDEFLEYYLNKGNSNIKVSNIETSNLQNRDSNINIAYNVDIKNAVSSFDNQVYIDLDFDKQLSNFVMEERKTDYIFSSKKDMESITRLEIPQGYNISHLPENISITSDNFDMSVNFSKENNVIVYKKQFRIKNAKIETTDFEEWNGFIKKLDALYNEQIILNKD